MIDANLYLLTSVLSAILSIGCLTNTNSRGGKYLIMILAASGALLLTLAAGSLTPNQNPFIRLITLNAITDRASIAVLLSAISYGLFVAVSLSLRAASSKHKALQWILFLSNISFIFLIVAKEHISPFLANPSDAEGGSGFIEITSNSNWVEQGVIQLQVSPTSLCFGDKDNVYVAGYMGAYKQNGGVVSFSLEEGEQSQQLAASGLTRPHGIAWHNHELFISRSGQFTTARNGVLTQVATGAITRLTDVNDDGVFELMHDIVSDLPGARLPDGLHQNNGITFNSTGELFVTVGNGSNAAPPEVKFEGTILRTDREGNDLTIYASGLRNPFGICVTESGNIYCSDNDANISERGDEINEIIEGGHYGHPYDTKPELSIEGIIQPVARLESVQGIASIPKEYQEDLGGHLLIANYAGDSVRVFDLQTKKSSLFARVPGVVAVSINPDGLILAASYSDNSVHIFSPKKPMQ